MTSSNPFPLMMQLLMALVVVALVQDWQKLMQFPVYLLVMALVALLVTALEVVVVVIPVALEVVVVDQNLTYWRSLVICWMPR